jgi:hypothetical protein
MAIADTVHDMFSVRNMFSPRQWYWPLSMWIGPF